MTGTFFRIRKNVKIKIKKGERTLLLKKPFQVMIEIIKMIKLTMLTKSISENYNLEGLVDFTFSPRNSIIKLHQIRYEISSLLFFIRKYFKWGDIIFIL